MTREDELLGFATSRPEFSTWDAAYYLHLDCLYLRPELRSRSVSRRVVSAIDHEAPRLGRGRIQWQTPVFNTNAIALYQRLGATEKNKVRFYLDHYQAVNGPPGGNGQGQR